MYCRLAVGNVRKSLSDYAIYFTTIMLGVASFYAFNSLAAQRSFFSDQVSTALDNLSEITSHLTVFLAAILGFLMVYANNYIMRRRKRELGLYQLLGMRSSQISFILVFEMLIASVASLLAGFALGILLSQLMTFATAALFQEVIKDFKFIFSASAFAMTLTCYVIIFLVMLACNLYTLARVKLSDLMQADRKNEEVYIRSLPISVAGAVVGLGLIIFAYIRILHDKFPFSAPMSDPQWIQFFITTGLGIVGTLLFFFTLSGAIFIVNRLWKRHYYRGLTMFTARQLASRVNTTSISMGVISLVLFFAITFVTSGMTLCNFLVESALRRTPFDASVVMAYTPPELMEPDDFARSKDARVKPFDIAQDLTSKGFDVSQVSRAASQVTYRELPSDAELLRRDSSGFDLAEEVTKQIAREQKDSDKTQGCSVRGCAPLGGYRLLTVSLSDYNKQRKLRGMSAVSLSDTECVVLCDKDLPEARKKAVSSIGFLKVGNVPYSVHRIDEESAIMFNTIQSSSNEQTIILPDAAVAGFLPRYSMLNLQRGTDEKTLDAAIKKFQGNTISGFSSGTNEKIKTCEAFQDGHRLGSYEPIFLREEIVKVTSFVKGIVAYFAVYIGFVFIVCCAAILAVQQLCNTADTALRYRLLSEIGCPRRLANRSLFKQTAYVFALPFVVALCHSIVALKVLKDFLKELIRLDIFSASIVCVGLFAAVYIVYFLVTYFVSRSIVNSRTVEARVDH